MLAAGSSTRLGRPKALVQIGDRTVLERILGELQAAGIARGVVVGGEHLDAMKSRVAAAPLRYAWNPSPEAGRMGSIVIGLASTEPESDVLLWPVDRPLAKAATVRALLQARERETSMEAVLVPSSEGRRGHPILIGWGLRSALLGSEPDANLREVLASLGVRRVEVAVPDPGIHAELDTEEDAARLKDGGLKRGPAPIAGAEAAVVPRAATFEGASLRVLAEHSGGSPCRPGQFALAFPISCSSSPRFSRARSRRRSRARRRTSPPSPPARTS